MWRLPPLDGTRRGRFSRAVTRCVSRLRDSTATHLSLPVRVGNTTTGNAKMQPGPQGPVVEAQGGTAVNIEQATVQSVLEGEQVEKLPINGRNFLDLGQLEPGVQIQDGSVFGPTKNGLSSISFLGQFGRSERFDVDGVDISDEIVGAHHAEHSGGRHPGIPDRPVACSIFQLD